MSIRADSFRQQAVLESGIVATERGRSFEGADVSTFDPGETKYFSFQLAAEADVTFALTRRFFKADLPDVDLWIFWNPPTTNGTAIPIYNNNRRYSRNTQVTFLASVVVNPLDDPIITPASVTKIREHDFIPAGEAGNPNAGQSPGQIGDDGSYREYEPGYGFIVRVTNNNASANKIKVGYQWRELALGISQGE